MKNKIILACLLGLLSANMAHAQSYDVAYSPQSRITLAYQCIDQNKNPLPYAIINAFSGVYLNTNGHFHDNSSRPITSVSPYSQYADQNGDFNLTLNTTLVGQAEVLVITCTYGLGQSMLSGNYVVGYKDVYYNDHPEIWAKIGGSNTGGGTGHGTTDYNRYMKSAAAYGLYYATQDYLAAHPGVSRICTNDMALPFGGKFDLNQNWTSPHSQHDRGTAADVSAAGAQCTNAGGSGVDVAMFVQACIVRGANSMFSFNEGNHAHCGFEAPTWPH